MGAVGQLGRGAFAARSTALVRRFGRDLGAALLLLAILALAAGAAFGVDPPTYDAGMASETGGSATHKIGVHALETAPGVPPYRWTTGYTFVEMPHAYRAAPAYIAEVRLRAANPAGPQQLTFRSNERPVAVVTPSNEFRVYRLLLPPPPVAEPELRFALETDPFQPPGDLRELGVIITRATLTPALQQDWPLLLTLALGPLALFAWARWRGAGGGAALLLAAATGLALLLLAWRAQPAPLRAEWMACLALTAAAAAALLAREAPARLGLALLCALVAFSGALWVSWLTDDAFISFRYSQNLVAGNGLVYNVGERVEGYTNFLWTMLAALALALGAEIVVTTYLAGVILALALVLSTYAVGRWLLGPGWALVAALLVATCQSLLVYTARGGGLETGLFALLALLASAAYLAAATSGDAGARRRMALLAGLIFALATLTRPEGAMLLALAVFHAGCVVVVGGLARGGSLRRPQALLRDFWPTALPMVLVYAALIVPFFIWRFSYYGDLLPNTFYVKTGGGPRVWLRGLAYLGSFALEFGGPLLILAPLALAARPSGADRGPRMEDEGQAPARPWSFVLRLLAWPAYLLLLCAAYAGYVVVVGGDHFPGHRFLVPIVPWLALLIAGGMAVAFRWLTRPRALRLAAPAILGLVLVLYSSYALTRSARYDVILAGNDESLWIWAEIGEWLRDNTAPEETVAAAGAGAIAYYSDRTAIDLLGLTERHIARLPVPEAGAGTAGHEKQDPVYVLEVRRPTYIPRIWDDYFGGEDSLRGTYELITVRTRHGRQIELWRRLP